MTVAPATVGFSAIGERLQLAAEVKDAGGSVLPAASVRWASDDDGVAEVTAGGLVTSAGTGRATITATSEPASGRATVTVNQVVASVSVEPAAATLMVEETLQLKAAAADANGFAVDGAEFNWSSSDVSVAAVDGDGLLTATGGGGAVVAVTSDGARADVAITVLVPAPAAIQVTPDTVVFTALALTRQLLATVLDETGEEISGVSVVWSSDAQSVARVSRDGVVTAIQPGRATIRATAESVSGTAVVSVEQVVASVAVEPASAEILVGDTLRLEAGARDATGHAIADAPFQWISSDAAVAGVEAGAAGAALVVGAGAGTATVTVVAGDQRADVVLTVRPRPPARVILTPTELHFGALGLAGTLAAQVMDDRGAPVEGVRVAWSSRNPLVAVVDSAGVVTAVGNGASTVTAEVESVSGTVAGAAAVTVEQLVARVAVDPASAALLVADTLRLSASASDAAGHAIIGAAFVWTSSDPSVAEVDATGLATGIGAGAATVTAAADGQSAEAALTVQLRPPDQIAITPTTVRLQALGATETLTAKVFDDRDEEITDASVGWASADAAIASVSSAGIVRAHANGTTAITATAGTVAATTEVTISQVAAALSLSPGSLVIKVDQSASLTAAIADANDYAITGDAAPEVTWTSSDPTIATASAAGSVTGIAAGRTTVKAATGDVSDSVTVEVTSRASAERAALVAFYESLNGDDWTQSTNWLSDKPVNEWFGVHTNVAGYVTAIDLDDNNLSGPIPPEIGNLGYLFDLRLSDNAISGSLPAELGQLARLDWLDLQDNALTGTLPAAIGGMTGLRNFFLTDNPGLMGQIPPEIGKMTSLRLLRMSRTAISGALPVELGGLPRLISIWIEDANLTSIPAGLGKAPALLVIDVGDNEITGTLPPELGNIETLISLLIDNNNISGDLPENLGNLSKMRTLDIGNNAFTGNIPPEFGRLANLRELVADGNQGLTGELPDALTSMTSLANLQLWDTNLCAPRKKIFQTWLEGIADRRVRTCRDQAAAALYVTQAVQSLDVPVPLVAGDAGLLRVFLTVPEGTEVDFPLVRATFYNDDVQVHQDRAAASDTRVPTAIDEGSLDSSVNIGVPGTILKAGLEVVVEVDPDEVLDASVPITRRIPESGRLTLDVRDMPALDLTMVAFLRTQNPDSAHVKQLNALTEASDLFSETRDLMPVGDFNLTIREPILTDVGLTVFNADALLNLVTLARMTDGSSGHYMGVISAGGVAKRAGFVGLSTLSGQTLAHELGHNFNLGHVNCGNAPNPDPHYPHSGGRIGAWGADPAAASLKSPERYYDLMGYCNPAWVSDYSFSKALVYREASSAARGRKVAAARTDVLLVWGSVDREGAPRLDPAFLMRATPSLRGGSGPYRLTGRNSEGEALFEWDFAVDEMWDGGGSASFVLAVRVEARWEGDVASITVTGPGGSDVLDGDSNRPGLLLLDAATGRLRGYRTDIREGPALRADAAGTGAAPGVARVFSRGLPRPRGN